jgi:D-sedoheptulose 7-phosphate isomerase
VTQSGVSPVLSAVDDLFRRRADPGRLLAGDAEAVARACRDMAARFTSGGRLIVFGNNGASADAQHVAVEFVHPVIVGKRALPAFSLASDVPTLTAVANRVGFGEIFAHQLAVVADRRDIALGISSDGHCENVLRGLRTARDMGLLTVALTGGDGGAIAAEPRLDHVLIAHSGDQSVVKEVHVTMYHVLWELVHVFFEQSPAVPA